jgi:hypothetical protein
VSAGAEAGAGRCCTPRVTRVHVASSPNSLWATCAATGGGEQSSAAGEDEEEDSATIDWEDEGEGDRGGASLEALS